MNGEGITGEDEVTHEADPAWLGALRWRDESAATQSPHGSASDIDAERTTEADADLVELVRAARQEARAGLAAPPRTDEPAAIAEPPERPSADAPPTPADEPADEPPALAPAVLPPPTQADFGRLAFIRTSDPPDEPEPPKEPDPPAPAPVAATSTPTIAPGRWQPPARLRPAEVPSTGPLLGDTPTRRRRADWRWLAVGIAAMLAVIVVIALRGGDDDPPPATDPSGSTIGTGSEPPGSDVPTTVSVP